MYEYKTNIYSNSIAHHSYTFEKLFIIRKKLSQFVRVMETPRDGPPTGVPIEDEALQTIEHVRNPTLKVCMTLIFIHHDRDLPANYSLCELVNLFEIFDC